MLAQIESLVKIGNVASGKAHLVGYLTSKKNELGHAATYLI